MFLCACECVLVVYTKIRLYMHVVWCLGLKD